MLPTFLRAQNKTQTSPIKRQVENKGKLIPGKKKKTCKLASCKLSLKVLIGLRIESVKMTFNKRLCIRQSVKSGQRSSAAS